MSVARRRGCAGGSRPHKAFRPGRPYRGLFAPPYNAASALSIPVAATGSPTPGAMHPDVIDFGSAWHGGRYWMAFTPYNGNADTELPSVVVASDISAGGSWSVPPGFTNPITPDPVGAGHMADTDAVYDAATDRLHVLYVSTDEATYQDIRSKYTTGDGTWSTENIVLSGAPNTYTNPSVIKTASGWRIYYNKGTEGLYYRDTTSTPASGYGAEQTATLSLNFGIYSRIMQNIQAVKDTDGSVVIIVSDGRADGLDGTLYFARSTDGGSTFTITGPPVLERGAPTAWDGGGIYRASLLVDTTGTVIVSGGMVDLWYSAYLTVSGTWGTAWVRIPVEFIRF